MPEFAYFLSFKLELLVVNVLVVDRIEALLEHASTKTALGIWVADLGSRLSHEFPLVISAESTSKEFFCYT
jgi:hypothetical protein